MITQSFNMHGRLIRASGLAIILCLGTLLPGLSPAKSTEYSFGVVPQFSAERLHSVWLPILAELEARTGFKFHLSGSPTIPAFETQFLMGEFDFAYMNPYHALRAAEAKIYTPMVRDVGRSLHGIIVVRKDSSISKVEDLDHKTIAFPAPNALGASLIPRADFKNQFKINIKPRYVQSHSSVYLNVALGMTDAGGGVQKTLDQQEDSIKNKLKVIYKTKNIAPHPIVSHKRIPDKHREKILQALLAIGETEDGKKLLSKIPMKVIGLATHKDYIPLKKWGLEKFYVKE